MSEMHYTDSAVPHKTADCRPDRCGKPDAPDFYTVEVTVKMTREQRAAYADEYGNGSVADDVAGRIRADVTEALGMCYWLREFATFSVSKVR